MTQPGISRKLAELRRLLADPLFVLVRRQLVADPAGAGNPLDHPGSPGRDRRHHGRR